MKKTLLFGLVLVAALVAALLLLPPWIDLGTYKARYLLLVAEALQREVDVGEVRLRIIPAPSVRVSALAVSDNPAFSAEPLFSAQRLLVKLKLRPLFKGQLQVDEFVLERPSLRIIKKPDGAINLADVGKGKAKGKEGQRRPASRPEGKEAARLSEIIPAKVRVQQGEVALQSLGQKLLSLTLKSLIG